MNTERWNDIWKIIGSGRLQFDQSNNEILCIICTKVLINAHSGPCGCRYCLKCITQYLNEEEKICPGTTDYCQDELISINRNIHPDQPMNQRILDTTVKCPHQNCEFTDKLRKIEDHIRICDIQSVKCPYLDVGCKGNNLANTSMKNHMLLEIVSHSKLLFEFLDNLKNEIKIINENNMRLEDSNQDLQTCVNDLQIKHENEYKDLKEILKETENKFQEEKENGLTLKKEVYSLNEELESLKKDFIDIKKCVKDSKLKYESENREIKENLTEIKNDLIEERENVEEITKEIKIINDERELMKQVVSENKNYLNDSKLKCESENREIKGKDNLVEDKRREKLNVGVNEESRTINILVLGETGVGKSTWINGFVNYLSYDSLEEAERGAPVSVIPTRFTVTDSDFNMHNITYGIDGDTNESTDKVGESVTQMPKSYLFNMDDASIRIVDTPGIADTRGIDQDKRNMQNILDHLAKYKHLNGIIVLLKPNNARLTAMFEYCIKELLTQLHKDASKNIVICFTHARGTNYRPGDTLGLLEELLHKNKDIDIKLNKDTVFFMDNEAVRYLMALKNNIFDETNKINSAQSWKNAVEESKRMISYISSLEPHAIQNTISINEIRRSINEIRRSITELSRPVADIVRTIQMNIAEIKKKDNEKFDVNKTKEDLLKQLQIPSTSLKNIRLDYPRTVCTASKCKAICDSRCTEINTVENVTGSEGIKQCKSMARGFVMFWTFTCKKCGCDWSTHMRITYEVKQETVMIIDPKVKDKIDETDGLIKAIEEHKKQLKDKLNQYRHEQKRLLEISAHFACFLKHNEIIPSKDALMDQLDLLTGNKAVKENDIDSETHKELTKWKEHYEKEKILIENRLNKDPDVINLENINKLMKELEELPNVGEMLKDALAVVKEANEASRKVTEKVINVSTTKRGSNLGRNRKNSFLFLKNKLAINKE